jgi:hypothetical protein
VRLPAVPPFCCPVVQSAERRSLKPDVGGANPSGAANAGRSSSSRAARSHRAGCRCTSGRPDQLLIVPERKVVERSPFHGESLAGASPARNASFSARGLRGIADPPDSESGSLERASRSAPTISHFPRSSTVEPPPVNRGRRISRICAAVPLRFGGIHEERRLGCFSAAS